MCGATKTFQMAIIRALKGILTAWEKWIEEVATN
jgi:hypothetical protein